MTERGEAEKAKISVNAEGEYHQLGIVFHQ